MCSYFNSVINLKKHKLFRLSALTLTSAIFLCVLFGNGVHFHSVLDHIFDHGDVHVLIHAHSHTDESQEKNHASSLGDEDHEVATVNLNGVLSTSTTKVLQLEPSLNYVAVTHKVQFSFILDYLVLLDLPPPDITHYRYSSLSFSLRAPPIA
jgi:hypothetical protein